MIIVYILLTISFFSSVPGGNCATWNHIDQKQWPDTCQNGKRQSPINLETKTAVEHAAFEPFHFINYYEYFRAFAKNTGHSIELRLEESLTQPKVSGGGLPKQYTLDHLHFHWQSEHTLNGHRYPLEVHLVHYASEYKTLQNALNFEDGIAVLGVFYDLSPDDDIEFEPLAKIIENVENNYNSVKMEQELELRSYLPRDVAGFYRYNGSLTTPGCNEAVIWTIFSNTIPVSKNQVKRFEALQSDSGKLSVNYRKTQPLGDRTVYLKVSPVPHSGSYQTSYNSLLIVTIIVLSFMLK